MQRMLLMLLVLLFSSASSALSIANVSIPEKISLAGSELALQGAGIRTKFLFNVYIGAFYAKGALHTPAQALSASPPKRMWFHFLREVPKEKIIEAWRDGFRDNNSQHVIEQNKKLVNQFIDLFDKDFAKGDIMTVDYIPGKGTELSFNGKIKGVITGEHFYTLVLNVWMGEHPPSQKFRKALLSFN